MRPCCKTANLHSSSPTQFYCRVRPRQRKKLASVTQLSSREELPVTRPQGRKEVNNEGNRRRGSRGLAPILEGREDSVMGTLGTVCHVGPRKKPFPCPPEILCLPVSSTCLATSEHISSFGHFPLQAWSLSPRPYPL